MDNDDELKNKSQFELAMDAFIEKYKWDRDLMPNSKINNEQDFKNKYLGEWLLMEISNERI